MKKINIIIFFVFYIFYLYFNFYHSGNIYSQKIFVDGNRCKVLRINGKLPKNNIYINNDFNINKSGIYTIYYYNNEYLYYTGIKANNLRNIIDNRLKKITLDKNKYNIAKAIILNEKSGLDKKFKNRIKQLSLNHLFSLSGLHFAIIYAFLESILFYFNKNIKNIIILVIITIYVLIIGFMPSITRAYIMIFLLILSEMLYESISLKKRFLITFFITILYNPYQIFDIAYLLTYISTFIIIYFKSNNILIKNLTLQIFLMPINYIYFGNINIIAFLINFIAIFLFTIYIYLLVITLILPINANIYLINSYLDFLLRLCGL